MKIVLLSILLGLFLLVVLYALLTRPAGSTAEGSAQSLLDAHRALARLQTSLLSPTVVAHIFSDSDLSYVRTLGDPHILELFLSERRRLALAWVGDVRAQILILLRFHRSQSGFYSDFSLPAEMSLVTSFWSLLIFCRALQLLVYSSGPFAARSIAGRTVTTAGRLCGLAGKPITFLDSYSTKFGPTGFPGRQASK